MTATHAHAFVREDYMSREAWLAQRRRGLGASDAAAVLGEDPHKSPFTVWSDKRGLLDERPPSRFMRWGTLVEDVVAQAWAEDTGRPIQKLKHVILRNARLPWLQCSPDAIVSDAAPPEGLEVKATSQWRAADWEDGIPDRVRVQAMHSMAVTGWPRWNVAVLIGGSDFRFGVVERDQAMVETMVELLGDFWADVEAGVAPDVDGTTSTTRSVAEAFRHATAGKAVSLPREAAVLHVERQVAAAETKRWEKAHDAAGNALRVLLGDAERGDLPHGWGTYTWKEQARKGYSVAASSARVLRFQAPKEAK